MNTDDIESVAPGYQNDQTIEAMLAAADSDLLTSLAEVAEVQKDCNDARLDAMLLAADDDLLAALKQCAEPSVV